VFQFHHLLREFLGPGKRHDAAADCGVAPARRARAPKKLLSEVGLAGTDDASAGRSCRAASSQRCAVPRAGPRPERVLRTSRRATSIMRTPSGCMRFFSGWRGIRTRLWWSTHNRQLAGRRTGCCTGGRPAHEVGCSMRFLDALR